MCVWRPFIKRRTGDVLYVSSYGSRAVKKIDDNGNVSVFADTGALVGIEGIAFDSHGNLYVAEYGNGSTYPIDKYQPDGVKTLFATGQGQPAGMVFDKYGNLYVGQNFNIEKFDTAGHATYFAGTNQPEYLATDADGNVYASTWYDNTVVKFDPGGNLDACCAIR